MGFVEEEKFIDTLVVDSEGFICGRVESFEIEPDRVLVRLYKEVEEEREVVDVEKLKEELMVTLFGKVSPKNEKKLYDKVRKELGLASASQVGEAELVQYARMLGLSVPTKVIKVKTRRTVEEPLDLELMECVNETPLGKCLILSEPWEARRRGIQLPRPVPYMGTKDIKGRLVIDCEAKIVGHAEKTLIGKPLGLRIAVETVEEEEFVDFEALYRSLLARFKKPKKLVEKVAKDLGIKPGSVEKQHILAWAQRMGIPIPKKKERKVVVLTTLDIPWTEIKKIGDVVILKKRIEDLRPGAPRPAAPPAPATPAGRQPSEPKPPDLTEQVHEGWH